MDQNQIPQCIGFIMDGNRRWAKERGLPTLEGHRQGAEVFMKTLQYMCRKNIPHGVFYAFSSENWNRSDEEVSYLLTLFGGQIDQLQKRLAAGTEAEKQTRIRFVGNLEKFPETLRTKIATIEEGNVLRTGGTTIWIALSYGGREEIIVATNRAIESGSPVDGGTLSSFLWTAGMPDPDIVVRTGGQQRLSNFLLWQTAYSELFFIDAYWPDLTDEILDGILKEFFTRKRNFGK